MTGNAAWLRMKLVGRTIIGVRLRPFTDGRGGKATNPELVLDDGTTVDFDTQETELRHRDPRLAGRGSIEAWQQASSASSLTCTAVS